MQLRTFSQVDLKGKAVLLRTDFNVPLTDGKVSDNTRIRESLPTIQKLIEMGARVAIVSHLGRPKGKVDANFSLKPVADELSRLLNKPIVFVPETIGETVKVAVSNLKDGEIALLENVRFHAEEEANDATFAKALSEGFDIYISDAFGTVHRAHASTAGVAAFLPSYAGFLLEKEIRVLSSIIENPVHPVCLIVGGAKIDTKIGILEKFLNIADTFLIGGALANTFLVAEGYEVGASMYEADKVQVAKDFLAKANGKTVVLPTDVVVAKEVLAGTPTSVVANGSVPTDMKILDLGPNTVTKFAEEIAKAKTVIWNGPIGLFEIDEFAGGTKAVAKAVSENTGTTVLGGGDTIDAVNHFGIDPNKFTHISTGGGAMLEFLEGKELPGVSILC